MGNKFREIWINFKSFRNSGKQINKTKHNIIINKDIDNLCTGIVKSKQVNILKSEDRETGWGYLASYENQSIIGDKLGMAVIYKNEDKVMIDNRRRIERSSSA